MGIASGLIWIVFGIVYIWYRAAKEDAETTISSTVIVIAGVGVVAAFILIYNWLNGLHPFAGGAWLLAGWGVIIGWVIKVNIKESKRKKKADELEQRAWEIVKDEVYTDEQIAKHADIWLIFHPEKKLDYSCHPEAFRDEIIEDYRRVRHSHEWFKLMESEGVPFQ